MKLKFAVMTGLVAVAMVGLVACASSSLPINTVMTGVVERTYTADEVKKSNPEKHRRYLDLGIASEADMQGMVEVAFNLYSERWSGQNLYAYIPNRFRNNIERDDFIQVRLIENGTNKSLVSVVDRVIQKHDRPGPCKFAGGIVGIKSGEIYCNGKSVRIIPPQN